MSEVDARLAGWLRPLAASQPEGRDARGELGHEVVRGEIAKLTALAGEVVDWSRVVAAAAQVLETTSKDLALAVYLARGLHELEGLSGLTTGLQLLTGLLRNHGDALYPTRLRARVNALQWFYDCTAEKLARAAATGLQAFALTQACAELTAAARDCLREQAPSASALSTSVERVVLASMPLVSAQDTSAAQAPDASMQGASQVSAIDGAASQSPDEDSLKRAQREAEVWLQPISAAQPAGLDTSYDEDSQAIRAEIQKLSSLAPALPDWPRVAAESQRILVERSKDMTLAVYLTAALFELRGVAGMTVGMVCLEGLLAQYWDSAWPSRARLKGRTAALDWLVTQSANRLAALPAGEVEGRAIAALKSAVSALTERVRVCFGAQSPQFTPLLQAITRLELASMTDGAQSASPASVSSRMDPPAPVLAASLTPSDHAGRSPSLTFPAALSVPPDVSGLPSFLKTTGEALVEVAKTLAELDRSAPLPYWLLRTGLWLHLERVPADEGGRTRIQAPERRARDSLEALLANQKWELALAQSEALLRRSPLWLDSHRLSDQALRGLGEKFGDAQRTVAATARAFVLRLPGVLRLTFADGSPLASAATLTWLQDPPTREVNDGQADQSRVCLPDALRTVLQHGDASALATFNTFLKGLGSQRQVFCGRLALAQALFEARRIDAAVTVYLGLERDLERFQLEEWEPALAIEALTGARAALIAQVDPKRGEPPELRRISSTLARLAPNTLV